MGDSALFAAEHVVARRLMRMRHNFFRFGLGMLFVLIAALSLLLAVTTPSLRTAERLRRREEAQTNLEDAIGKNDVASARLALKAGADPNGFTRHSSLLRTCVENGQLDLMELLLRFGVQTGIGCI